MRNAIEIVSSAVLSAGLLVSCENGAAANNESSNLSFAISFPEELSSEPLDGRVLLLNSIAEWIECGKTGSEPFFMSKESYDGQPWLGRTETDRQLPKQSSQIA